MRKKTKHPKHDLLVNDYENQKRKHLEKVATRKLKKYEIFDCLKNKEIDKNFFEDLEF